MADKTVSNEISTYYKAERAVKPPTQRNQRKLPTKYILKTPKRAIKLNKNIPVPNLIRFGPKN